MKKYKLLAINVTIIILIMISLNKHAKSQETVSSFNGIWNNKLDKTIFYIFKNGEYISICFTEELGIIKDGFETGIYGFYSSDFDYSKYKKNKFGINKESKESDSLALIDKNGFFLGYEYELGDRSLNLYNQNAFFYERLYTLSPKIIADLRIKAKNKKINIDDFIYSYETVRSSRAIIHEKPNIATKMYLIKGNKIKIIGENLTWLKFVYNGKKIITGWIKKSELE